jgi:hypothetical protein
MRYLADLFIFACEERIAVPLKGGIRDQVNQFVCLVVQSSTAQLTNLF